MPDAALAGWFPLAVAAYLCCYGPGHAWWRGRGAATPRAFARFALSLLVTSIAALTLVALDSFSLPRTAAIVGIVTLVGYLGVGRVRHEQELDTVRTGRAGALVFFAALCLYWPPFEAHLAASDASSYLGSGVQLARERTLASTDDLGPLVPPLARHHLFFSALGSPWKPPYSRVHGGLVIDRLGATEVRPSFFPLPSAWAGLFSDALGARYGGGYAGLFAAAAVWGFWILARARLGFFAALSLTVSAALNAAGYWAGRMPLAEPLAWFFAAAAWVALDAYEEDGLPADARLAGAMLGAVALVRIEYVAFLLAALAARRALSPALPGRRLGPGFASFFLALTVVSFAQAALVPGAYTAPLEDTLRGLRWIAEQNLSTRGGLVIAASVALGGVFVLAARRIGLARAMAASALLAVLAVYARMSPDPSVLRSLRWLGSYLGWATLGLAAAGAAAAWRRRFERPADAFLVISLGLIGACLLYDPHVYPSMPWASRRYVPVVIPLGLLFAGSFCSAVGRRSLLAGLVAWGLLVGGALWPAHPIWGRGYFEGTYDQLNELAALIPSEGSLLIDDRLIPMMVGPALWLAHGRQSLPASLENDTGRKVAAGMARVLAEAGKAPVYLLKPTLTAVPEPLPLTQVTRVGDMTLQIPLPDQTDGPPPSRLERYTQSLSLFRLEPVYFGR